MIAYLSGIVLSKQERSLTLSLGNTGYRVHVTRNLIETKEISTKLSLFTHMHVREDDISLYGFETEDEWKFFELLLTVSGVGPRSAMEILNAPISKVKQAIAKKDVAYLIQIPGIGRKTGERIIVDLQGKIKEEAIAEESTLAETNEDIVRALVSLGYHRQHVIQGLKKIPAEINGEEAIIKYFLQNI